MSRRKEGVWRDQEPHHIMMEQGLYDWVEERTSGPLLPLMVEKMMCEEMCNILMADTSTLASDEAIEGGVENF